MRNVPGPRHRLARGSRRAVALSLAVALAAAGSLVAVSSASAVGTVLFQNGFANRTVDGTGSVVVPTPTSGSNSVCLTASGNTATLPLLSCAGSTDAQGAGKLRMTSTATAQVGGVFGETSFPTSNGLDVTFNTYQWGGAGSGGDGMSFVLAAVDPTNPAAPAMIGPSGGSLGYSPAYSVKGLPNAYLGVGLDVFGNFSNPTFQGSGCPVVTNINATVQGTAVVRGPGNNLVGYCALATTYTGIAASKITLHAATRATSAVPVQVLINPTATAFTSTTGATVDPGTYKVLVTPIGQAQKVLTGALPTVAAGLYPSSNWLSASGVPRQLAFGFVGSTGSVTDAHEASDVKVLTFNPVPELSVATTSYTVASPAVGDPVTYSVQAKVQAGANESNPISMTLTAPAGVVPAAAFGTGWGCAAPVGQSITCTTTGSFFLNGSNLNAVTVIAVVTSSSMTSAIVQTTTTSLVSSIDANPDSESSTTPGTLSSIPSGIALSSTIGPVAGGNSVTLTGSNLLGTQAIEIGTAAEMAAGTPVVVLQCALFAVQPCFTNVLGILTIGQMPARATAAPVLITVVATGVAGSAAYTYASAPATPAAPTAVAGVTSATATWTAPAANGSPITGYTLTSYLNGVLASTVNVDQTVLSRAFTSLVVGGSYTFAVSATNAYGTSAVSPKSTAVVPYTTPGTPTITAVSAGTNSATLTWTTPGTGSSPITGWVVTPYIGAVAQTPQTFTGTGVTRVVTGLTAGTAYTFTVAAKNAAGTGSPSVRSLSVTPNVSPSLAFAAPPPGEVGVAYGTQLTVAGGTAPFSWAVSAGTLPPGITLSSAGGLLAGIPTAAGSHTVTVQVTDASGEVATKSVTIVVAAAAALTFAPAPGEVAVPYLRQPVLTGGVAPITWSVSGGTLPPGVTIDPAAGTLSGTPTTAGTYAVTITATDALSQTASAAASLVIVALPALTFAAPVNGRVGVVYSNALSVSGGTLPLAWSVAAGALPDGLTLNAATGVISGTPTTVGTSSFTVLVVDANGQSASRATSMTVNVGPIAITTTAGATSAAPGGTVVFTTTVVNISGATFAGVAYSDSLVAILDDADYNGDLAASSGTAGYASGTVSWNGTVAAGATVSVTWSATVHTASFGDSILTHTVVSPTAGANCGALTTDARCSAQTTVSALTIIKTADVATAIPGDTVTFSILVTNTGRTAFAPATVSDPLAAVLDDATYNLDAVASRGAVAYSSVTTTLGWSGTLAPGEHATVTFSVTVTQPVAGDRSLRNVASSMTQGSTCTGAATASCTATVTVRVPLLDVSISAGTPVVVAGGVVHYTIVATNVGQTNYPLAQLVNPLVGVLDDAVYNGDAVASRGGLTYLATVLVWTGSLATGQSVSITYSVTTAVNDTGDAVLISPVTSSGVGSSCLTAASGPQCASRVVVSAVSITLSQLGSSFTLRGVPNSTVTQAGAVSMLVTTNSLAGYVVTVRAQSTALVAADQANGATIPVANLQVSASGANVFAPLSTNPLVVSSRPGPSAVAGDLLANDYRVNIPAVPGGDYSVTLEYIVSTQ